jgi:hypothetical protein
MACGFAAADTLVSNSPMNIDGFIALSDAQIRESESQAGIADKLADIPDKLAHADLTEQQAVKQHLENVAKLLSITWDQQAHQQLLQIRNLALQKARSIENEGKRLAIAIQHVGLLMNGEPSWEGTQSGWIGFDYLRGHLPFGAALRVFPLLPELEAYEPAAWLHSNHPVTSLQLRSHDPGSLIHAARIANYYPLMGGPAWLWLSGFLQGLADCAAAEAAAIQARLEVAQKSALELEKLDWDRLKPASQAA